MYIDDYESIPDDSPLLDTYHLDRRIFSSIYVGYLCTIFCQGHNVTHNLYKKSKFRPITRHESTQ